MELLRQESSMFGASATTKNLSSSSSAFVSASQSPFFSPRSPREDSQLSESNKSDNIHDSSSGSQSQSQHIIIRNAYEHRPPIPISYSLSNHNNDIPSSSYGSSFISASQLKHTESSALCNESSFSNSESTSTLAHRHKLNHRTVLTSRPINAGQSNINKISFARTSASLSSSARFRSCDVYIGTHGQKPSLLRFTKWLRAELELQGIACFAADRARYTDSRSHDIADKEEFGAIVF
ncbi:hypothetical protein SUGI_0277580 [Cryptomeria japonica]|nr:hypothetical protein SUGI_0277580 [Cryptomeria japonica]